MINFQTWNYAIFRLLALLLRQPHPGLSGLLGISG
jgi:hypothetical protein